MLAILVPKVGVPSQTFIRQHIEMTCPGRTIVVADAVEPESTRFWDVSVSHLIHDEQRIRRTGYFWTSYKPSSELKQFLHSHQASAVMGEWLDYSWRWLPVCRKMGLPFYAHCHGYDVSERQIANHTWRRRYLDFRYASGIITVSELTRQRLVQVGLSPDQVHVIPCGVRVSPQPPVKDYGRLVQCLYVGRMVPKKSPLLTLESFRLAADIDPDLRLKMVGDGPLFSKVLRYVSDHQLGHKVELLGALPSEHVSKLYDVSHILLQHHVIDVETGDEEGLPVAILEAMSAGLAVVSTRHAGIPEAVVHEVTGLLSDESDTVQMSEYLKCLSRDRSLIRGMGMAGWHRAREKYTCEVEAQRLRSLMKL